MASVSDANGVQEQQKVSRKRKRKPHPEIPTYTPSLTSTPGVYSQAPRGINATEFAEARALEIQNMTEAIKEADRSSGKRVFQSISRHMRRRTMSHNIKRLPLRLRGRALNELKMAGIQPQGCKRKKKSRRERRKPKNLLEEYSRRQRKHIWLETHIWHAKRMKMIDVWGYRLAEHPNDKGFRAAYRSTKNFCLLQDISYYSCIEVRGVQSHIINAMSHVTSKEAGLTMAAKYYLDGSKEGHVFMYKCGKYPYGAIGPVSFLWRPRTQTETATITKETQNPDSCNSPTGGVMNGKMSQDVTRLSGTIKVEDIPTEYKGVGKEEYSQLWIWSHPACYGAVFDEVVKACKSVGLTFVRDDIARETSADEGSQQSSSLDVVSFVNGTQLLSDTSPLTVSQRFDLIRFHLTGPLSHALLASTLRIPGDRKQSDTLLESQAVLQGQTANSCHNSQCNPKVKCSQKWWHGLPLLENDIVWNQFKNAWSPSVLPPWCVIGLTVLDPRFDLPGKKRSVSSVAEEIRNSNDDTWTSSGEVDSISDSKRSHFESSITQWPFSVAASPIWDESVCQEVKQTKIPEQELNNKRSKLLLPGSRLNLNEEEISHIPVLLIQQPGCRGYSNDPTANPGYGSGWDIILPSGWAMAFWIAFVYRGARTGGLKDSRFSALEQGVPFFPDDFPDTPAGECYNKSLKDDGEAKYWRYPPAKRPSYVKLGFKYPFHSPWRELVEEWSACEEEPNTAQLAIDPPSVHVGKGSSLSNAGEGMLQGTNEQEFYVLRTHSDLNVLRNCVQRSKQSRRKDAKHQESLFAANSSMKELSLMVKRNPNSLVFVSLRMSNRGVPLPNSAVALPLNEDVQELKNCKDYTGPVEPVHKGGVTQTASYSLKCSCQREMIGFVSSGHLSLSRGCGFGVGFCALPGLVKLISSPSVIDGELVVLVRNPSSRQYRLSYLSIL